MSLVSANNEYHDSPALSPTKNRAKMSKLFAVLMLDEKFQRRFPRYGEQLKIAVLDHRNERQSW